MHRLDANELRERRDEITTMLCQVARAVPQGGSAAEGLAWLDCGAFRAWEHEGALCLVRRYSNEKGPCVCIVASASPIKAIVGFVRAWMELCRLNGVREVEVCGRRGWERVSRKYGLEFVRRGDSLIAEVT